MRRPPGPSTFHADRGYGSNYNCQILFETGIALNIKQRSSSVNRGKPYRGGAAKIFDEEYHQRGMIEGIFGGEESKRRQLTAGSSCRTTAAGSARSGPSPRTSRC